MGSKLAENVRRLRESNHMTQEAFAEVVGVSPRTIQRIEAGRQATLETLKSIAAAFDLDVDQLQGFDLTPEEIEAAKKVIEGFDIIPADRAERGSDIASLLDGSTAHLVSSVQLKNDEEEDAFASFQQEVGEWFFMWDDLGPMDKRNAARFFQEHLEAFDKMDLIVTIGRHNLRVVFGGKGDPWPITVAHMLVCRAAEPKTFLLYDKSALINFSV